MEQESQINLKDFHSLFQFRVMTIIELKRLVERQLERMDEMSPNSVDNEELALLVDAWISLQEKQEAFLRAEDAKDEMIRDLSQLLRTDMDGLKIDKA